MNIFDFIKMLMETNNPNSKVIVHSLNEDTGVYEEKEIQKVMIAPFHGNNIDIYVK